VTRQKKSKQKYFFCFLFLSALSSGLCSGFPGASTHSKAHLKATVSIQYLPLGTGHTCLHLLHQTNNLPHLHAPCLNRRHTRLCRYLTNRPPCKASPGPLQKAPRALPAVAKSSSIFFSPAAGSDLGPHNPTLMLLPGHAACCTDSLTLHLLKKPARHPLSPRKLEYPTRRAHDSLWFDTVRLSTIFETMCL
jgi:hypothetical protein